jgi:hypothetical protein
MRTAATLCDWLSGGAGVRYLGRSALNWTGRWTPHSMTRSVNDSRRVSTFIPNRLDTAVITAHSLE